MSQNCYIIPQNMANTGLALLVSVSVPLCVSISLFLFLSLSLSPFFSLSPSLLIYTLYQKGSVMSISFLICDKWKSVYYVKPCAMKAGIKLMWFLTDSKRKNQGNHVFVTLMNINHLFHV